MENTTTPTTEHTGNAHQGPTRADSASSISSDGSTHDSFTDSPAPTPHSPYTPSLRPPSMSLPNDPDRASSHLWASLMPKSIQLPADIVKVQELVIISILTTYIDTCN